MSQKSHQSLHWLLLLVLCLLLVALPAGCGSKKKPQNSSTPSQTENEPLPDPPSEDDTPFTVARLSEMKIIYPKGASEAVMAAAQSLADAIRASYRVELQVSSDYIRENSEYYFESEYEILIGQTNRDEDDAYTNLRQNDSLYTAVGTKILIMGGNDYSVTEAVTNFTYDIVTMKKGGKTVFFDPAWGKNFYKSYTINSLTLNGAAMTEYTIVYPAEGARGEVSIAKHLANRLEALTGYTVNVKKDISAYKGGYEILIGNTSRQAAEEIAGAATEPMTGVLGGVDHLIVLSGADSYGINTAVEAFLAECVAAADSQKAADVTLGAAKTAEPATDLSVMTFNLQTWGMGSARNERVLKMISTYLPDVLGVQEANDTWMFLLEENFGDYYQMVGVGRDANGSGEHTAILMAKHRLELLESGTRWLTDTPDEVSRYPGAEYNRIYTYAKLTDKVSNQIFLHVNTHFDLASDAVRTAEVNYIFEFLHNYEDVPVLLTGDMNARLGSSAILTLQKGGLKSTSDMFTGKNAAPVIDWIFTTADCVTVNDFRICNERINGDYASDHHPVLVRVSFFVPEGGIRHDFREVIPVSPEGYLDREYDKEGENFKPIIRFP